MSDHDLAKLIGVKATKDPWVFESVSYPGRAGNQLPIAYGGCTSGTAVVAAGQTMDLSKGRYVPYSVTGYFLGPASLDYKFECHVTPLRDTRSFITRNVVVKQQTPKGPRSCLVLTIDFISSPFSTAEKLEAFRKKNVDPATTNTLFNYQVDSRLFIKPDTLPPAKDEVLAMLQRGEIDESVFAMHEEFLGLWYRYFEGRSPPDSVLTQKVMGFKAGGTSQDYLPVTERRAADWFRPRSKLPPVDGSEHIIEPRTEDMLPISSTILQAAVCVFALDGVLAFVPISMNNRLGFEAGNASSLDFAVRFHSDIIDMSKWHMREVKTIASGWSRTFSEAYLFDEDAKLVASTTQQCVMRPAQADSKL